MSKSIVTRSVQDNQNDINVNKCKAAGSVKLSRLNELVENETKTLEAYNVYSWENFTAYTDKGLVLPIFNRSQSLQWFC